MSPDGTPPDGLDTQKLGELLGAAHDQVVTAIWLSVGMLCAFGAIAGIALNRRRAALVFGFCYSLTLCFVRNGHAKILGPAGCAVAFIGLLWPQWRSPPG